MEQRVILCLTDITPVQSLYLAFIDALKAAGFDGELNPDYANRTVLATDNSIYQVLPQAVVYPKHIADLQCVTGLASKPDWRHDQHRCQWPGLRALR